MRRMRVNPLLAVAAIAVLVTACDAGDDEAVPTSTQAPIGVSPGPVAATELVAGDCLGGFVLGEAERVELESADLVSCEADHELEVFATFELDPASFEVEGGGYPGRERIVDAADAGCDVRFEELGDLDDTFGLIAFWPTSTSWSQGDRSVACAAFLVDGSPFQGPTMVGTSP